MRNVRTAKADSTNHFLVSRGFYNGTIIYDQGHISLKRLYREQLEMLDPHRIIVILPTVISVPFVATCGSAQTSQTNFLVGIETGLILVVHFYSANK